MKLLQNSRLSLSILILAIGMAILNAVFRVPSTEGFNPSDEGVILAQSYRLLQGETPHRDFISIRPVGSAVMHMVHFFSPLPLVLSSRWLTLAEYFLYSLFFALFLTRSSGGWREQKHKVFVTTGITLFMFILNENHYNLFPWTTIDALLWFSIALHAWGGINQNPEGKNYLRIGLLFLGISASVLCRQTFLLPGLFLSMLALLKILRFHHRPGLTGKSEGIPVKETLIRIFAVITGLMPGWIYAGMLTFSGGWTEFLKQMTGRTELWETGFMKFSETFWGTPVWFGFVIVIIPGLLINWLPEREKLVRQMTALLSAFQVAAGALIIVLSFTVFLFPPQLFLFSYGLFWLLAIQILILFLKEGRFNAETGKAAWIILVAWTSALSLGDNAPVFAAGLLAGSGIVLLINTYPYPAIKWKQKILETAAVIMLAILSGLSVKVQKEVNYRDKPDKLLTSSPGNIFDGLKGIRSNQEIFDYLLEIKNLYVACGSPVGRFAVWPNNALIYALLESPNPFALDWMQGPEFPGSEERIIRELRNQMESETLFILVEKFNVKWLATEKIPLDRSSPDYPYLFLLEDYGTEILAGNSWFTVYRTR